MERETILIVDDEKEIRDLLDIYLRNEGYDNSTIKVITKLKEYISTTQWRKMGRLQ